MLHSLTAEQSEFRDVARRFLSSAGYPAVLRDDSRSFGDGAWWSRVSDLGWLALVEPRPPGGPQSAAMPGFVELALIAHEFGAFAAPGPLIPANLGLIALSSDPDQRFSAEVEAAMAGEELAVWAPSPASNGSWSQACKADAGYLVSGSWTPVEGALEAHRYILPARLGEELVAVVVEAGTPGVRLRELDCVDIGRTFATVELSGVEVSPDRTLIWADDEFQRQQGARALALQCAEMVGAGSHVFDLTLDHLKTRRSFGRPLASYQALKHEASDLRLHLDACRAITAAAVKRVASGSPDMATMALAAKSYVGDHVPTSIQRCIQLHGGVGVTWEHDLHLYLRRAITDRALVLDPRSARTILAARVLDEREDIEC